jgi:hypothetical protein
MIADTGQTDAQDCGLSAWTLSAGASENPALRTWGFGAGRAGGPGSAGAEVAVRVHSGSYGSQTPGAQPLSRAKLGMR